MRLHYLSTSTLISDSANSVHVMKMADALAGLDHEVTLHGLYGQGCTDAEVHAHYGTRTPFRIRRWWEHEALLPRVLLAARARLPFVRVGSMPSVLHGRYAIRKELALASPDVIFARNISWLVGANLPHTDFIVESHRPPPTALDRQIEARIFSRPSFRLLVVISDALKALYQAIFPQLPADQILVAHDAADDPFAHPASELPRAKMQPATKPLGRSDAVLHVGYVGHLFRGRGGELIRACAERLPTMDFHLVGGRPADIDAITSGAPSNIIAHGHQPHSMLHTFFPHFDVMLAPYQRAVAVQGNTGNTAAFMSPLKLFEYMAWAKPMLVSDLPVLHEVLTHGETALLLPPDDVDAWVSALLYLANNPRACDRLAMRARAHYETHYSWQRRAQKILAAANVGQQVSGR